MVFVCFGGFTVSAHTLWMHNKLSEGQSVCSGDTILNCDGLIGNLSYNTDPLFGQPWGLIGMVAFTALMWLVLTIGKDPMSPQAPLSSREALVLPLLDFLFSGFSSVMKSMRDSFVRSVQLLTLPTSLLSLDFSYCSVSTSLKTGRLRQRKIPRGSERLES